MKLFIINSLIVLSFVAVTPAALAAPNISGDVSKIASDAGYAAADQYTLSETVGQIIRVTLSVVGTLFLALAVYAGFLWMTAGGNEENIEKAKNILKAAVIGLVISLAAYGVTIFVVNALQSATGSS